MSLGSRQVCVRWLSASILVAVIPCCAQKAFTSDNFPIHSDISFTCLWWSEAQMENLNPNSPPPKNTEVKITKWEYSDPIGVPHPDEVQAVVTLSTNNSESYSNLDVEISKAWKVGPLRHSNKAIWERPVILKQFQNVELLGLGKQSLRVPVVLKTVLDELSSKGKWPFSLQITVTVHKPGSIDVLNKASTEFAIIPGD